MSRQIGPHAKWTKHGPHANGSHHPYRPSPSSHRQNYPPFGPRTFNPPIQYRPNFGQHSGPRPRSSRPAPSQHLSRHANPPVSTAAAVSRRPRGPPGRCEICSYRQPNREDRQAIYHHHFSTKQLRELTGVEESDGNYFCPTCGEGGAPGKVHASNNSERIKILVSSSTLHEYWEAGGFQGHDIHVDHITIPGATIQMLEYAWRCDYHHEKKPMDVMVVGGLNNLCRGDSADDVIGHFKGFEETVMKQSREFHPDNPSTFNTATMFYPPQITWFPDNGDLPYPEFENKLEMMKTINDRIVELNNEHFLRNIGVFKAQNNGVVGTRAKILGFHKYGLRKTTTTYPNGRKVESKAHRWEHWRELDASRMLHLIDEQRAKACQAVANFFRNQFNPVI